MKARQLIMKQELPSSSQRRIAIQTILNGAAGLSIEQRSERLSPLIDQSQPIEDLIFDFFEHKRQAVQLVAMEVYIRRVYQVYHLSNIQVDIVKDHGMYISHQSDHVILYDTCDTYISYLRVYILIFQ